MASLVQRHILPLFGEIGLIVPMPASTVRQRQPVTEIAKELSQLAGIPVFEDIIVKSPPPEGAAALKNLNSRDEKDAALKGRFSINPSITNAGRWNALLLDDLFDTGATMEAVCASLKTYGKVGDVYVASITWK